MLNTPILLITFNRPQHTRRVLEAILAANPKDLYVFQDGARVGNIGDVQKCQEVRDVINELVSQHLTLNTKHQTPLTLHTNYSDVNLGCGPGPYKAISWFFENVEQGIILEDDCVAHPEFFPYCEELLNKYKNDCRIAIIGGANYCDIHSNYSYSFCSGHQTTWGWATWRRTWQMIDYKLDTIDDRLFGTIMPYYMRTWTQKEFWWYIWRLVKKDQMNGSCWDYQFYWSFWKNHMLAICPSVNLICNVGYGEDATHTRDSNHLLMNRSNQNGIFPLNHPNEIKLNWKYDLDLMRTYVNPYDYGWAGLKRLPYRLNRWIKRLCGHQGSWFKSKK